MNKKITLQVFMGMIILFITLLFFFKYFKSESDTPNNKQSLKKTGIELNTSSNYIDNINYKATDLDGNKYEITAEQAEIDQQNSNIMFLKNVISYVYLEDSSIVKITSDFGKYNLENYDTIFSLNVIVDYPAHKITGEYLDFSFLNNLGTISRSVIYKSDKNKLLADKIEINIKTKDTKIFMDDNNKKVLIIGTE